ncbi:MAG: hypothetical protein JWQ23_3059 [Herminiimonas sp.]|nr:hypothetical protein [Herminiimonas sp.]
MHTYVKFLLLTSVVALVTSIWFSDSLPPLRAISEDLKSEPMQELIIQPAFEVTVNKIDYTVAPLYAYEITGLVVSKHNADTWWDYIHKRWNDSLNVTDLCVIWGNNVRSDVYAKVKFSSESFTCNFRFNSQEVYDEFDMAAVSNNHLITGEPRIAKKLRNVQIGDQIRVKGMLAEYSHNHGFAFKRGTSTVRTDTGNGACETVYVEDFEVIKSANPLWRNVRWAAIAMILLGVVTWFALPMNNKP